MSIRLDALADSILRELAAYNQEVTDALKVEVKDAAKECVAAIREKSPKKTGRYRKGWAAKSLFESDSDIRLVVHNKTDYQLTHLLEHGHAKAGGGRVEGKPHIRPAEEAAADKLEKRVKVRLGSR